MHRARLPCAALAALACAACTSAVSSHRGDDETTAAPPAPSPPQGSVSPRGPTRWRRGEEAGGAPALAGRSVGISYLGEEAPPPPSVTTDKASYAYGEPITVTYANMAGNWFDWVSFAPQGSSPEAWGWFVYTKSNASGTVTTALEDKLPSGTYVARAHFDDSYVIEAESAPFVVGAMPALTATVTTDKASYTGLEPVSVTYAGLAGTSADWVGSYKTFGSMMSYASYTYTDGQPSGTVDLWPLFSGTWEIRAFESDGYELAGRSATVSVSPEIATDKSTYGPTEAIVVRFGGSSGLYKTDRVALAEADAAPEVVVSSQLVDWEPGGTRTFDASGLAPGIYVARLYFGAHPAPSAESASFVVVP